ncbi:HNH endonuclease [Nonomuraea angiospora]|uniref:HNH endonuclease n=1 Tax=Nonomuraea angiospora TaxID=46172 RepID=UPI0029B512FC|nr:HNH endonuclease [Nonomuraea angiospora]MDX3109700.1 HNH endonuclease [Nonomuraea angiospora]
MKDPATLLEALVQGADTHGRYFADEYLLRRLFWWHSQEVPPAQVAVWRDQLVQQGEIIVAPLALSCYDDDPIDIATIVNRQRFPRFAARPAIPATVRAMVYARDGHACRHCGATADLSIDHIHPFSRGGSDDLENFQTLCRPCNSRKGARIETRTPGGAQ